MLPQNLGLNVVRHTEQKRALEELWDYLSGEDPLSQADLAFVFGGPGEQRVHEAIKLYKNGFCGKILFSGKQASYLRHFDGAEADYYAGIASQAGVPEADLILEREARNTPENVVNSVAVLRSMGSVLPRRVIIVTAPYHLRRASLTFKAVADWSPLVIRRGAPNALEERNSFYLNEEIWTYAVFEYLKIHVARLMQHF